MACCFLQCYNEHHCKFHVSAFLDQENMSNKLPAERYFPAESGLRKLAQELYEPAASLPIISPHGHVDPGLFSDPKASFGSPADLFIIPDHYVTRMLYSAGVSYDHILKGNHRDVWRTFCERFYLFRGTPSGIWLTESLADVFGIHEKPKRENADALYDQIASRLDEPEFTPRRLFERFNIELLATTDPAVDMLEEHRAIRGSDWEGHVIPTFRPDALVDIDAPGWHAQIECLSEASGITVHNYRKFIQALEQRREYFRGMGACATDHAAVEPAAGELTDAEAEVVFTRALQGDLHPGDPERFTAHMLMEMARMSVDDGMVMQLHTGSLRNYDPAIFKQFGPDRGMDIPQKTEFTHNLQPLLNRYGRNKGFTLIVFTLDETAYSRELAPLAGVYPALKLGPPWWFLDSLNGMARYFDLVMETAGIYNTAGFNDDTRAFCSIPVRHDLWRRASASWLAKLVARHVLSLHDAHSVMQDLAYNLVRSAYNLDGKETTA